MFRIQYRGDFVTWARFHVTGSQSCPTHCPCTHPRVPEVGEACVGKMSVGLSDGQMPARESLERILYVFLSIRKTPLSMKDAVPSLRAVCRELVSRQKDDPPAGQWVFLLLLLFHFILF